MPLVLAHNGGNLTLADDVLVIALDDTGHEELHEANGACFGIGGCGFMVSDYERLVEAPWNLMLKHFFPDVPRPIHAVEHFRSPTKEQLSALTHFFTKFEFFRLAVTVSSKARNAADAGYIEIVGATILNRIAEVAEHGLFSQVFILFEASERIDRQVMHALSGKKLRAGHREFPIELGVIPKSACAPAMEVADVIAHTACGQTRHRNERHPKAVRKDFKDIFQSIDRRLVSFTEITCAEPAKA